MPNSGKPTVWTGTRKLSPADRLLAAVLTRRWRTPRAGLTVTSAEQLANIAGHELFNG